MNLGLIVCADGSMQKLTSTKRLLVCVFLENKESVDVSTRGQSCGLFCKAL